MLKSVDGKSESEVPMHGAKCYFCRVSINSTPSSPSTHAKQLRRVVDKCQNNQEQNDE